MSQLHLFEPALGRPEPERAFDGKTYEPKRDFVRLSKQQQAVFDLMGDGKWRTLAAIAEVVGCSEAGASARLRDLRKAKYGGHQVDRLHVVGGLHQYRMAR